MDGDDFSSATRLGRPVAEGVISVATDEAPLDGFATAQLIDHCGLCTSCMFRRIAIASAGVPDPTRYRDTPSRRHNSNEVAAFEHHAADRSRIATLEDLTDLDPNVRFAFNAPTGVEVSLDVARSRTVEMYRRYGEEIQRVLGAARPKLRPRAARPAKEVDRDLFAAAR